MLRLNTERLIWTGIALILLCAWFMSSFPDAVETWYSGNLYPPLAINLSKLSGWVPVSLAELFLVSIVSLLPPSALLAATHPQNRNPASIIRLIKRLSMMALAGYALFICLWGLNYHRIDFASLAGIQAVTPTTQELTALGVKQGRQAALLRTGISQDDTGIAQLSTDHGPCLQQAVFGYQIASRDCSMLAGDYAQPKEMLLSPLMSKLGLWGIYCPFTFEAQVNTDIPGFMIPSTACHEMAHQRGFAREDEANYIAYLTCMRHPDPEFQYSGTLLALINVLSALRSDHSVNYAGVLADLDEGVKRDLTAVEQFQKRQSGILSRVSSNLNHLYLKLNGESAGVASYNRMINLLAAEEESD